MGETAENLESMNEAQLRDLIQRAQEMLRERGTKRLEELRQLAKEAGYQVTLTKIWEKDGRSRSRRSRGGQEGEERGTRRHRKKVQQKYRNPEDPGETWSGRGRKPKWVQMALAHDRKLEDFAIPAGD